MRQYLKISLFFILFESITGNVHKYTPEIFNVALNQGVKYHVVKNVNKCPEKALLEQTVTLHYSIGYVDGENVISIGSTRTKDAMNIVVGGDNLPRGKPRKRLNRLSFFRGYKLPLYYTCSIIE